MRRLLILAAAALALGGCALRGPLRVECPNFAGYTHRLAPGALERQVRDAGLGDGDKALDGPADDPIAQAIVDAYLAPPAGGPKALRSASADPQLDLLLLSGGGQWGAFGVGFMGRLVEERRFPDVDIVTGVSTGGLQALFVGAGIDRPGPDGGYPLMAALTANYSPEREEQIVRREKTKALAAITGAMANLTPLKRKIEQSLCPALYATDRKVRAQGRCMVDQLAAAPRLIFIGFIDANSGEFRWVDTGKMLRAIARESMPERQRLAVSTQCLAGAALASAAMPVFFQQVRVDGHTYYDGGVRESVFLAGVERGRRRARAEIRAKRGLVEAAGGGATGHVYVIRNGPTTLAPAAPPGETPAVDRSADALNAALRAEAIVVNQLEVGSLMALRLQDPGGPIDLVSAEGWTTFVPPGADASCGKIKQTPKDAMFNPAFMRCLQALGRERATRPWTSLCRFDGTETRRECGVRGVAIKPMEERDDQGKK